MTDDGYTTVWGLRFTDPNGSHDHVSEMVDQEEAEQVATRVNGRRRPDGYRAEVVCRRIGPWTTAPAAQPERI